MKRFVASIAVVGFLICFVIFVISEAGVITEMWWFNAILYVWPTYLMLLPFSGPVDGMTMLVLLISAVANAAIYAIVGAVLYLVLDKTRRYWARTPPSTET